VTSKGLFSIRQDECIASWIDRSFGR